MKELLSSLIKKGIRLGALDGQLKIQLGNAILGDEEKAMLKENKQAIIEFLGDSKIACLSYPQERLWFLAQLGYSFQYHIPGLIQITGKLDAAAFQKTINYLVSRHESLRTGIRNVGDTAMQVIQSHAEVPIKLHDLTGFEKASQDKEVDTIMKPFVESSFDLGQGPLMRAMLIKLSEEVHILGICMHHIISDGWSAKIIVREIAMAYEAYSKGEAPTIAPLQLQYAGYAVWQRETLNEEKLARELSYWEDQLTGHTDLNMPTDYIRPAQLSGKGDRMGFELSAKEMSSLRKLCQDRRTTSFTAFMTGLYILLMKYSNQKDICVGTPTANRNHKDLESLIGFFINTLVMRMNTTDNDDITVGELIDKVQKVIIEGQDHQNLPIEKIVEVLQPERDLSRTPIFQILVNYAPVNKEEIQLDELTIEPVDYDYTISKFDLTFAFSELADGGAALRLEYSTDLYKQETIEKIGHGLIDILGNLINWLDKPLSSISLLRDDHRTKILEDWNETAVEYPKDKCIHDLFEQQANATPDSCAIVFEKEELSYKQLNDQSTQLAIYLQNNGLKSGSIVGLCLERSPKMIIAIMAILKAGGAYLPLDTNYPEERINHMIDDSQIEIILSQDTLTNGLTDMISAKDIIVLSLDTDWDKILTLTGELNATVKPNDLAYVIYTSGSTGKPKGVMVEHTSVVNHNLAAIDIYDVTAEDRVLQFSTVSFDIFVEEVFPTLLSGAALVLMDGEKYADINYVKDTVRKQNVSVLNLPTAFWHAMVKEKFSETSLRLVIIGGEKADINHFQTWRDANPKIDVINTYGPTETTVICLYQKMFDTLDENRAVPIGRPIQNTQAYVLDHNLEPVPEGLPGELYISGAGLARGYVNDKERTKERFLKNPFVDGARMYKTGDLARWLPEGVLEYLGRTDHQVKIRGFRVEIGEVENGLLAHPEVDQALVLVKKHQGTNYLVGFYQSDTKLSGEVLNDFATKKFPDYMVPSVLESVEQMPLTPNGKIDRKKLQKLELKLKGKAEYVAPETDLEHQMVAIWQEVLGVDKVGMNDSFFELGGHSLLATKIIARINNEFSVEVSLSTLFETPIVSAIVKSVEDVLIVRQAINAPSDQQGEEEIETMEF